MKGRDIALLVLIVTAGLILYMARTGKEILRIDGSEDIFNFGEKAFVYEDSQIVESPIPAWIEIDHSHGDVEVQSADQENINLTLRKKIWRKKGEESRQVADKLKTVTTRDGDRISISVNREDFTKKDFETDLVLIVPRNKDVRIRNSHGTIRMQGVRTGLASNSHGRVFAANIQGELTVNNSHGDIDVEDAGASCRITERHADVRIRRAAGPLRIEHGYGKIDVEDSAGDVVVLGDHSEVFGRRIKGRTEIKTGYEKIVLSDVGPTSVQGPYSAVTISLAAGDLLISNSSKPVKLNDISGDIIVEGKSTAVFGQNIAGREIRITSSYEDVKLFGFSGKTTINLSHGDAVLEPSSLEFPIAVHNTYSHIRFSWPKGERGPLEARSHGGEVVWSIAGTPSTTKTNGDVVVTANLNRSGKPAVELSTSYGDITVTDEASPDKKR